MRAAKVAIEQRDQPLGLDEFDTVIAAEMPALVVPPVGIADRVALLRIGDERTGALGEFAVGHHVDALVADQPEAGPFALTGPRPIVGIAEASIGGGIGNAAIDDLADGKDGKGKHRPTSRCRLDREMAQMHRQLGRDLIIGEFVEQLQRGALPAAITEHRALAAMLRQPAVPGIATVIVVRGAPDMLQPLFARHRLHRPGLALDDGIAHYGRRSRHIQIAIGMIVTRSAVDAQCVEDAGDAIGKKLA